MEKYNRNAGALVLNDDEKHELLKNGSIVVIRRGFEIQVDLSTYNPSGFEITIINPYDRVEYKSLMG